MAATPITATTQEHLPVYDIQENLVILKNGGVAMVIETSAVNFGLLSEQEQDAIIYAYAALLNSLNFPIQILIRSSRKDISAYLQLLDASAKKQSSDRKRRWITAYRTFIADTVQRRNVLDKKFYIVIPFQPLELGTASSLGKSIASSIKPTAPPQRLPAPLSDILKKGMLTLVPKRDHIVRQLERIGLVARQLTNQDLLSLLYQTYNPGSNAPPIHPGQFTSPLVTPLVSQNPPPGQTPSNPNQPQADAAQSPSRTAS